ncbi:MORN repeat-containing protein 5-like [Bolinopsis microptera]|uniref:MORN repeat-containing protein 5-like n=1 Tax=Bolinopsis microptera TaxID=2820187 RepID=UPI00307AA164
MDYTGSSYKGDMKNDKMEGEGEYAFPSGTKYIGSFKDGTFEGKGTLHFKNGSTFSAVWKNGIPQEDTESGGKYKFKDGLEFSEADWNYCDGYDRRFYRETLKGLKPAGRSQKVDIEPAPPIPKGWYDCGDGVYNPDKRIVYSYSEKKFIRNADVDEHKWIVTTCRRGSDFFVGKQYVPPTP